MYWFEEIRRSKIYQFWRAAEILMLFACKCSKQVKVQAPQGEWWSWLGLKQLETASTTLCHWWCFGKTVGQMSLQLVKQCCNELKMLFGWWNNKGKVELLSSFADFSRMRENEDFRKWGFSVCTTAARVTKMSEKWYIFAVLGLISES